MRGVGRLEGLCFTGINFSSGETLWARLMLCQLEVVKLTPFLPSD